MPRKREGQCRQSGISANMSHELRTPLNHVIGFSELLYHEQLGSLSEVQKEHLKDVMASGRHLLSTDKRHPGPGQGGSGADDPRPCAYGCQTFLSSRRWAWYATGLRVRG
ncbi:MAG: hypothetical protein MZV64_09220 [Ignavibacteriales bacterium]|nr:hypothetical protein [Ignavibacteriales bacterium]